MADRLQYVITNGNTGTLEIKSAGVSILGNSQGKAFMLESYAAEVGRGARVTVTAVPVSKGNAKKKAPVEFDPLKKTKAETAS